MRRERKEGEKKRGRNCEVLLPTSLLGSNRVVFNFYRERKRFSTRKKVISTRREKGKAYVSSIGAGLLGPDRDGL